MGMIRTKDNAAAVFPRHSGADKINISMLEVRAVGRKIGNEAWLKALTYFNGTAR